jgi:hypothetical protein
MEFGDLLAETSAAAFEFDFFFVFVKEVVLLLFIFINKHTVPPEVVAIYWWTSHEKDLHHP